MSRYTCDIPGLEQNFVEFSDVWSRADRKALLRLSGDEWIALLAGKITALHLDCPGHEPLTTFAGVTDEMLDNVDLRVYNWFVYVPSAHVRSLDTLGEASGRRLFEMPGDSAAQTT